MWIYLYVTLTICVMSLPLHLFQFRLFIISHACINLYSVFNMHIYLHVNEIELLYKCICVWPIRISNSIDSLMLYLCAIWKALNVQHTEEKCMGLALHFVASPGIAWYPGMRERVPGYIWQCWHTIILIACTMHRCKKIDTLYACKISKF